MARKKKPEMTAQGKPIRYKMHVKKGDTVQIIAGKDKGKVGEIMQVLPKISKVVVKDVNVKTKHVKPQQEGESVQAGQEPEESRWCQQHHLPRYPRRQDHPLR